MTNQQIGDVIEAPPFAAIESLDARALDKFGQFGRVPTEFQPVAIRFSGAPGVGFKIHPVGDVLMPKTWELNYANGEFFRDKPAEFDFRPPGKIFMQAYADFIARKNEKLGSAGTLDEVRASVKK